MLKWKQYLRTSVILPTWSKANRGGVVARPCMKDEGGVGGGNVKPRLFEECEGAEKVDFEATWAILNEAFASNPQEGVLLIWKKKHETWRKQKRISFSSRRLFNFSFTHDSPFASNLLILLFTVWYDPYFNFSRFIISGMYSGHCLNRHLQIHNFAW